MLVLPSQTPGVAERHGLTRAQAERSAWAVDRSGRAYQGAAAMNRALLLLRPPWPSLAWLYAALPPVRWLEDRVYAWIATHRPLVGRFWSDPPECEQERDDGP